MAVRKKTTKKKKSNSKKSVSQTEIPVALQAEEARKSCNPKDLKKFTTTKTISQSHEIISQARATDAINTGLGINKPGYNIYVAGILGTGKTSVMKGFLEKSAKKAPNPKDIVYTHDFDNPEQPKYIFLESSQARILKKQIDQMIKRLQEVIPANLQGEKFETEINSYLSGINERKTRLFNELENLGKGIQFEVKTTKTGIETIPLIDGEAIDESEYGKLTANDREDIESRRTKFQPHVLEFARQIRAIDQEVHDHIESARNEVGKKLVKEWTTPIIQEFSHNHGVVHHLKRLQEAILDNIMIFAYEEEGSSSNNGRQRASMLQNSRDIFRTFRVNIFVDHSETKGAPIIIENNPTYYNLFGRVEKNVENGMYVTDYSMIKAGAVHRANGGYLVINSIDIFKNPAIWDTLKRMLRTQSGFIEDMGDQYSMHATTGLRPKPIPLDMKIILIGSDDVYHYLYEGDEDFSKIFKVKADFNYKMPRSKPNMNSYVDFLATRSHREELKHFDKSGVAAIIEFGSRLVEDQNMLSTQFGKIKDLTIEADFIARQTKSTTIKREHVQKALDKHTYRHNLYQEQLLEMVDSKDILISVKGKVIGQVNGLTVLDIGDYCFGKVARLSAVTSINDDGIINVDRSSRLTGKIHDKGMAIIQGYLNGMLARKKSLGFSASVCFEQSYGMIDGDSASVAELTSIISSLAQIPIRQNLAMTGSLNQFGEVQPVGGINEKLEGFWQTTQTLNRSKTATYDVIIPQQNAINLMLHPEVAEAVKNKRLNIYPARYFHEVFEIATGEPLGASDIYQETFDPGSALDIITKRISNNQKEQDKEEAVTAAAVAEAKSKATKTPVKKITKKAKKKTSKKKANKTS